MWLILTLLACVFFAAGAAMQKHGMATAFPKLTFARLRSELGTFLKTILRNWIWLLGLVGNLVGGLCYIIAIDAGEVSVVQPIVNLNLLLAMLIGVVALHERLQAAEWIGAAIMAGGAALVLLSAQGGAEVIAAPDGMDTWALGISLGGYGLVVLLAVLRSRIGLTVEVAYSICGGILFGLAAVHIKQVSLHLGAAFNGEEVALTAMGAEAASNLAAWALIPDNVIGFLFFQLAFSNGRVAVVSPVTNIAAMVLPVVAGALAFGEPVGALRLGGVAIVMAGIVVMVKKSAT